MNCTICQVFFQIESPQQKVEVAHLSYFIFLSCDLISSTQNSHTRQYRSE